MRVRERVMAPRTSPLASPLQCDGNDARLFQKRSSVVEVLPPSELHARVFAASSSTNWTTCLAAPSPKRRKELRERTYAGSRRHCGKFRRTRLFPSHEQAELVAAIADTQAMFEGKRWRDGSTTARRSLENDRVMPGRWLQLEAQHDMLGCQRISVHRPSPCGPPVLGHLWEADRRRWSAEAVAVTPKFNELFTRRDEGEGLARRGDHIRHEADLRKSPGPRDRVHELSRATIPPNVRLRHCHPLRNAVRDEDVVPSCRGQQTAAAHDRHRIEHSRCAECGSCGVTSSTRLAVRLERRHPARALKNS
jgi:hypothetical protein